MKSKLHYYLVTSLCVLSGVLCQAFASDFKTAYALSDREDYGKGIYTFEIGDTIKNVSLFQAMTYNKVCGGQIVDDTYYYLSMSRLIVELRCTDFGLSTWRARHKGRLLTTEA